MRVNDPILGNKVIDVKGNIQDNHFGVDTYLEADVLGSYIQMSEKGLSNKYYKNIKWDIQLDGGMDLRNCNI